MSEGPPAIVSGRKRIFFDTDPGPDDALALAFALGSPDVEVVGAAATAGNDLLHVTADLLARTMAYLGSTEVRLAVGSNRRDAFIEDLHEHTALRRLRATLLAVPELPPDVPTGDLLLELLETGPAPLTLVALAPMTNIADFARDHPAEFRKIEEVVLLAGAFQTTEFTHPRSRGAELNVLVDPEAASDVLGSGHPNLTLVSLDVTNDIVLSAEAAATLDDLPSRSARLAAACYRAWCSAVKDAFNGTDVPSDRMPLWDPVATAVAIDGTLARTERRKVQVQTSGDLYGCTRFADDGHELKFVTSINVPRFISRFLSAMQ